MVVVGIVHALLGRHRHALGGDEVVVPRGLLLVVAMALGGGQSLGDQNLADVGLLPADGDGTELPILGSDLGAHGNLPLVVDGNVDVLAHRELPQSVAALVGVRIVGLAELVVPGPGGADAGQADLLETRFVVVRYAAGQDVDRVAREGLDDDAADLGGAADLRRLVRVPHSKVGALVS